MDGLPTRNKPETELDRTARIAFEDAVVAKAEAEIAAGRFIDGDDLFAWLEALDRNDDTPPPPSMPGR